MTCFIEEAIILSRKYDVFLLLKVKALIADRTYNFISSQVFHKDIRKP